MILELLNATFQASLLSEESRPLSFRLAFCQPADLEIEAELRGRNRPLVFPEARKLTVSEIVRLAPAADPTQLLIGVWGDAPGQVKIWGLIDSGLSWWEFAKGERAGALGGSPPPDVLTVSTSQRGSVTVSRGGMLVCGLRRGLVITPTTGVFSTGPFARFLESLGKTMMAEVAAGINAGDSLDVDDLLNCELLPCALIERVLARIAEAHHGGTIVIVPESWTHLDSRLTDRLSIKYPLNDSETWPLLVRHAVTHHKFYKRYFPAAKMKAISGEDFRLIHHLDHELKESEDLLRDRANLIATLAAVDGAVVLTKRLQLLGFGAEIVATSLSTRAVFVADSSDAASTQPRPLEDFGTRHRSVIRLCASSEDVGGMVVSQDGDVRAVLRVGANVVMWPTIGENSLAS